MPGHLSAGECGQVARRSGVKKLILSHLYPSLNEPDTRLDECRAAFAGDVVLAEDLMVLEV